MKLSKFNLSHRHHTTMEMGKLVPFYVQDCLPGDIFRISNQAIFRAQPMVAPVISQINWVTQYYFVPYRILWDNWTEFITGGDDGLSNPAYPTVTAPEGGWQANSLADYFGFPIKQAGIEVSALPFRAMAKIWNDHYKIDDIEVDVEFSTTDGPDSSTPTELMPVHWKRDYFTKAKPFTQRGAQISVPVIPAVKVGSAYPVYSPLVVKDGDITQTEPTGSQLVGTATCDYQGKLTSFVIDPAVKPTLSSGYIKFVFNMTSAGIDSSAAGYSVCPNNQTVNTIFYVPVKIIWGNPNSYSDSPVFQGSCTTTVKTAKCFAPVSGARKPSFYYVAEFTDVVFAFTQVSANEKVDLGSSGAINMRDLRVASAYQRFNERSLKYGAEYEDYCRMEFGVRPRDSRLNKSEYLGGNKAPLQISEVIQTAPGAQGQTPLGNMAGMGIGQARQRRIKYFCPEHGIIIGFASIRPETIYTQGIDRAWLKRNRFDYFTYEFANIGAQEIMQQELYATKDNKNSVFGYALNGNYNEYRHQESRLSGNFRTDLSFWHLGRQFAEAPVLNQSFMKMNPRKDIFAITDDSLPAFLVMLQNNIIAYRPIPKRAKNILK